MPLCASWHKNALFSEKTNPQPLLACYAWFSFKKFPSALGNRNLFDSTSKKYPPSLLEPVYAWISFKNFPLPFLSRICIIQF